MRTHHLLLALLALLLVGCPGTTGSDDDDATTDDDDAADDDDATDDDDAADDDDASDEYPWQEEPGGPVGTQCGAPLWGPEEPLCEVTEGDGAVLMTGIVVREDEVFLGGQVLVDNTGTIQCFGCDCEDAAGAETATQLTCPWAVVSPGLINAHDHISFIQNEPQPHGDERYEHRHDWRRGRNGHTEINASGGASSEERAWGELRFVLGGGTSILGSGNSSGLLRNLDADDEGLATADVEYETFPLGDSSGFTLDTGCDYPSFDSPGVLNAGAYTPHIAEGIDRAAKNEMICLATDDNGGEDLIEENTGIIHAVGITAAEGAMLAAEGASVIWSPRSNIDLYGNTAPVTMLDVQGVTLALGTDWTPSGSMNVLRELACAQYLNEEHFGGWFPDWKLWRMATTNAALATGVDANTGQIQEGYLADLALFDGRDHPGRPFTAILEADVGDVVLTMRGGDVLAGESSVVEALPGGGPTCEELPMDVCGQTVRACLQREIEMDFDGLEAANSSSYDLFSCDIPDGEPSCEPFRPDEYDGVTPTDQDGDGVEDTEDNCPAVFNPIRPMDYGEQLDVDGDGLGDSCDPCPIGGEAPNCAEFDPNDRDGDGEPNDVDNCPDDPNPGQEDGENDGVGDLCDPCPLDAQQPGFGCPVDVWEIKQGFIADSFPARVEGLVVTAVNVDGWFAQLPDASQDATLGVDYSAIFTYGPADTVTQPAVGDLVSFDGVVNDWFGQWQLGQTSNLVIDASDQPLPTVEAVTPAEVTTGGSRADALEGALVQVLGVEFTSFNPPAGPGDLDPTNAWVVDGVLRINDYLTELPETPLAGDVYDITGVLRYANEDSKIEPRDAADVAFVSFGPPVLVEFGPDAFAYVDATDAETLPSIAVALDRPAPVGGIVVNLTSADDTAVDVDASVTVLEGETEATVLVDALTLGGPVTLEAEYNGDVVTTTVTVIDPTTAPAIAAWDPADGSTLPLDAPTDLTLTLDLPARAGGETATVALTPGTGLTTDASVTFAEGELSATLTLTPVAAGLETITVTLDGTDYSATYDVASAPLVGLILTEVLYDIPGADDDQEWVEIYNGTGADVDLSTYSIAAAGTDYTWADLQLTGTIPSEGCWVVGGPNSTADNGNPTFDVAGTFGQGIQNSGSTADAVGLFDVPASQVGGNSVPIDAVIYGGSNGNNLVDETGSAGNVDVDDAPAGSSIERLTDGTWQIQATPSPGDCSPAL